jgi:hypothetical protein
MMTTTADRPDPGRLMPMSWSFAAPLLVEAGVRTGLFDLLELLPRLAIRFRIGGGILPSRMGGRSRHR